MSQSKTKDFGDFNDFVKDFKEMTCERQKLRARGADDRESLLVDFLDQYKTVGQLPENVISEIVSFKPNGVDFKFCEIIQWVFKVKNGSQVGLDALEFMFSRGMKPSLFVKQTGATILGVAAYTGVLPVVRLSYKYATKEECRLVIGPELVGDGPDTNSTLLHRLVDRYRRYDKNIVSIVQEILKNDPEAVLQAKGDGRHPDQPQNDFSRELIDMCLNLRAKLEKEALTNAVSSSLSKKPKKKTQKLL